ncbi:prevent-host-death family protein [Variovorax sp. TBS-050B]|uniref:type II toxin-antitoxin system prevent-host-death family antitoxin n=1 Tax=Variovorax sp. TBS-050B TaxID=2940551 RepID=UPI0024742E73|nr:type II toxin-antitoxin system prevent-host-death family antitoxin [Variovorax sp. TBS-050B]MDH6592222.1 prevent-host-death family protein [Variovorax sp. TBS-050B]
MPVTSISSRDFTRDVAAAKRAAAKGPVYITNRGVPEYVLQRIEDYDRDRGQGEMSLLALMDSLPDTGNLDFEPPRADIALKTPDFG